MTTTQPFQLSILLAEDDLEDQMFVREALQESGCPHTLYCVKDGQELVEYLENQGQQEGGPSGQSRSLPDIILLDLNMPRKDGREVLRYLKQDPELKLIPVVVMTTSNSEQDILTSYAIGANTYMTKPVTYEGLVSALQAIAHYWFAIAKLPNKGQIA
jgi:CheY-like chemotaxis protein